MIPIGDRKMTLEQWNKFSSNIKCWGSINGKWKNDVDLGPRLFSTVYPNDDESLFSLW